MTEDTERDWMGEAADAFSVDDYMYFYSDFLSPEHNDIEAAEIANVLGMDHAMRVLDLACGFGRIANRLAGMGHHVTGVEYQQGFLAIARQEAAQMGVLADAERPPRQGRVAYHQGDMREVDYHEQFERVIMVFNSFGYFSDQDNRRVLRNAAQALKKGGILGFDVANRDGVLNDFHPHYISEKDDSLLINRFSFDPLSGRLLNERIVIRDGARKDRPFSIRLYSASELRDLLAEVGLELVGLLEEWDGTPFRMDSPSMVVIAGKR